MGAAAHAYRSPRDLSNERIIDNQVITRAPNAVSDKHNAHWTPRTKLAARALRALPVSNDRSYANDGYMYMDETWMII